MSRSRGGAGRAARTCGVPRPGSPSGAARPALRPALRAAAALGAPAALLLGGLLAFQPGGAAFRASSASGGSTLGTASVSLALDHGATPVAMISLGGAQPGQRAQRCIRATYTGSVPATVRVSGAGTATAALDPHLRLVVEQGGGGTFAGCSAFTATSTAYDGTLAGFRANHASAATGVGTWAPAANGATQSYRFTVTVSRDVPTSAAGKSTTVGFTWWAEQA
ncbi:hypothetical protein NUM3379_42050 [Kineococcus sp. NUM-3379]